MTRQSLLAVGAIVALVMGLGAGVAEAATINAVADYRPGGTPGGGVVIVDNSSATRSQSLSAPGSSILDLDVTIDYTKSGTLINPDGTPTGGGNAYYHELYLRLTSPGGTTVNLVNANTYIGGQASATAVVTFDDAAASAVGGVTLASGTFRPVAALSAFNGEDPTGSWTLLLGDTQGGDPLSVNEWSLTASIPGAVVPVPAAAWGGMLLLGGLGVTRRLRRRTR